MKSLGFFYNHSQTNFGICGDRENKTLPLVKDVRGARILDVGCWTGFFGEKLKRNGNYVVGWDISARAVARAKKNLDEGKVVDLESKNWPKVEQKFDLIIFTEVLEHLFSPEAVLIRLKKYLRSDGRILLSTPNILHLYRRVQFFFGRFNYQDDSVINRSHLHFFTRDTFVKMVINSGFEIVEENDVVFPRTLAFIWKRWANLFANQTVLLVKLKHNP